MQLKALLWKGSHIFGRAWWTCSSRPSLRPLALLACCGSAAEGGLELWEGIPGALHWPFAGVCSPGTPLTGATKMRAGYNIWGQGEERKKIPLPPPHWPNMYTHTEAEGVKSEFPLGRSEGVITPRRMWRSYHPLNVGSLGMTKQDPPAPSDRRAEGSSWSPTGHHSRGSWLKLCPSAGDKCLSSGSTLCRAGSSPPILNSRL